MARSDAARNAAFQIPVAVRRAVQGGSAVLRTDPPTARVSLARRPWASPRISPGPRRAPSFHRFVRENLKNLLREVAERSDYDRTRSTINHDNVRLGWKKKDPLVGMMIGGIDANVHGQDPSAFSGGLVWRTAQQCNNRHSCTMKTASALIPASRSLTCMVLG